MGNIENATSYETAIEIIGSKDCGLGVYFLQHTFIDILVSGLAALITIKTGGQSLGKKLSQPSPGITIIPNPMRMSHYDVDNNYLPQAQCRTKPNLDRILLPEDITLPVVFAEAVVESQGTILAAIAAINGMVDERNAEKGTHYPHPVYHTLALVSKTNGDIQIPNLTYAFSVSNQIWVHGWSCDDCHKGRTKRRIFGRMKPKPDYVPPPPYSIRSLAFTQFLAASNLRYQALSG